MKKAMFFLVNKTGSSLPQFLPSVKSINDPKPLDWLFHQICWRDHNNGSKSIFSYRKNSSLKLLR